MPHPANLWPRLTLITLLVTCTATLSCTRRTTTHPSTKVRRIASLVPAATDMLIAMGAGDHLVAVSNFESLPDVKDLPRVGDYQTTDWETLARLRPDAMIIQIAPNRLPPGLKQRAAELGIELVNVKIDRLDDVFDTMQKLGTIAGEPDKASRAVTSLRQQLEALRVESAQWPSLSTLIVRDENGRDVIGPDNFLDDLLKFVHATNAASELGKPYPSIDREKLVALAPQAVIVLLPDARTQTVEVSNRFWASMTQLPAVQNHRVCTLTDAYALVPGARLGELARKMATCLRPAASKSPTTQQESAR
jgi:ABC-type Fe3+-hydroxamate transport system substrate-binding protein